MFAVELLEAYLRVEDGSLDDCLDFVLAGFWHLVRTRSFAFYLLALDFLSGCLHCSLGPVFLLDHRMRLRAHFCFDGSSVARGSIALLKFGGQHLLAP